MIIKLRYKQVGKMPKRNKLSQRRSNYKRKRKEWELKQMQEQRKQAWMVHEMIDEDLRNLYLNPIRKERANVKQEEE